jgi:hypothetical protein
MPTELAQSKHSVTWPLLRVHISMICGELVFRVQMLDSGAT